MSGELCESVARFSSLISHPKPRTSDVVVLCWDAPTEADYRAQKIIAHLGVEATFVSLSAAALMNATSLQTLVPRCAGLIADANTLADAADALQNGASELRILANLAEHILIYGFQPTDRHNTILKVFSSGYLARVRALSVGDSKFHVADGYRNWCGQFSGLTLGAVDESREHSFLESGNGRQPEVLIRAGDQPFFVRTTDGDAQIFFWGSGELADLDEPVRRGSRPSLWFSRLAPLMMFLRGALGDGVWHNDHPQACLIIDDPLVKSRYGFLEYDRLLEVMRRRRFSTCIAFIPWNYRRSSKEVAALIASSYQQPFLCVHGCDHTGFEFASADLPSLRGKAQLALERMREHRQRSGIPFDDVMVFPQGRFSAEAVTALKDAGYLAAVNGDVCPATSPEAWTLRDLLSVAVTKFSDFPLFGRRYPREIADFAFDLFMGKPVLAAEHHTYFRNGYQALEGFVDALNSLDERLQWASPGMVCSHACLTRTEANGEIHVRFYTSRFSITNDTAETRRYVLQTHHAQQTPLPSVTVDGRECACEVVEGGLQLHLLLEPGKTAEIRVQSSEPVPDVNPPWKPTEAHNAKVRVRRVLSEFRDNYVDTILVFSRIMTAVQSARSRRQNAKDTSLGALRPIVTFLMTMLPAYETLALIAEEFGDV